jgi:hypothetical protein
MTITVMVFLHLVARDPQQAPPSTRAALCSPRIMVYAKKMFGSLLIPIDLSPGSDRVVGCAATLPLAKGARVPRDRRRGRAAQRGM